MSINLELIRFWVSATGPGMDAETASHLFEPFTKAETASSAKFGGTGLGLSISRRLLQAMGGDVQLTSSLPRVGTTFTILIPANSPIHAPEESTLL
jgi:signal transduction histidine kinase